MRTTKKIAKRHPVLNHICGGSKALRLGDFWPRALAAAKPVELDHSDLNA